MNHSLLFSKVNERINVLNNTVKALSDSVEKLRRINATNTDIETDLKIQYNLLKIYYTIDNICGDYLQCCNDIN